MPSLWAAALLFELHLQQMTCGPLHLAEAVPKPGRCGGRASRLRPRGPARWPGAGSGLARCPRAALRAAGAAPSRQPGPSAGLASRHEPTFTWLSGTLIMNWGTLCSGRKRGERLNCSYHHPQGSVAGKGPDWHRPGLAPAFTECVATATLLRFA